MELTGSQILMECLKEQGVDTVFGFPGGAVLYIYDELFRQKDNFKHILTSHEQGAAHAADAYSRSTGRTGVCIATSGPGATNLVTGIATAYMDSVPLVAITGNVPVSLLGKDSFQEIDVTGITAPITKHNYIVRDVNDLADVIREAFYIANEGRPGPVLIDIPKDVSINKAPYEYKVPRPIIRETEAITQEDLEKVVKMIEESEKPYIFAGGGVTISDAKEEAVHFAELVQAPVTCSLMGMGGFPGQHELYTGMIGMHGTKASNIGVQSCDLLIAIGARFSDRVTGNTAKFAMNAKVIHIDIDPAEINKNVKADHFIIGDVKEVLMRLNTMLHKQHHEPWLAEIKEISDKFPLVYPEGLTGQYAIEKLYELTKGDAIITTEVGQHQMWASQYYKFKDPKMFITSGGLGTMGYGTGAALGAQAGNPDKLVVNIAGDGSFRMNLNEMITAVRYNLPIKVMVINNCVLGMVRQWQTIFYDNRYSFTHLTDINYDSLADAFGCKAINITTKEDVEPLLKKALEMEGPVIINVVIHMDEMVYPMVAPGAPIDDLITE
ncbi:biosynthetic-type acetolactate synthase large subunit [Petrocella sp. FN5]|uniref:biosynthetic-type acetolactate synthase large subunit n=1 Tax=Petrocella sp. FN5 TaxID=3032002 RepID=UPI0023DBA1A2|nr:biosynthetic-type acetolactate synthase large subunit [Petrocella sp. FN5]MDF1617825.1 biosynthetic-type acetolactate synthase large subunit [Petrocella sp. FN5]